MNQLRTITKATGVSIGMDQSLRTAAERMATEKTYALAVLSSSDNGLSGMISYKTLSIPFK